MDDPWGSPWATPDPDSARQTQSAVDATPEPPARAFFTSNSHVLSIPSSQSVWLDSEVSGEWTSPDLAHPPATSGWAQWGANEIAPGDSGQLTPRYEPRRKLSNPQWPSSRSTSPGLQPTSLPRQPSSDRLSPDPWASDLSLNRDGSEPTSPLPQIQHLPSLPTPDEIDPKPKVLQSGTENLSIDAGSLPLPSPPIPSRDDDSRGSKPRDDGRSPPPQVRLEPAINSNTSASGTVAHLETPRDEPLTILSESAPKRHVVDRKASKVQELVDLYDGIEKKKIVQLEPLAAPKRSSSQGASPDEDAVESDGDFPLVVTKPRGSLNSTLRQSQSDDARSSVLDIPAAPKTATISSVLADFEASEGSCQNTASTDAKTTESKSFEIDMSTLDQLFPEPASKVNGDDVVVPNRIVTDSFDNVSERKAWYRISRYGPMRRHDMGDDDKYRSITWASSTMRPEIIKTVRRWMEEDSIGGRSFRGGLGKGTSSHAFGWGHSDDPVDLARIFGRKRPVDTPRQHNTGKRLDGPPPPAPAAVMGRRSSALPSLDGDAVSEGGFATFGWSSNPDAAPLPGKRTFSNTSLKGPTNPAAHSYDASVRHADRTNSVSLADTNEPRFQRTEDETLDDDDDDDWGEMMSPTGEQPPEAKLAEAQACHAGRLDAADRGDVISRPGSKHIHVTKEEDLEIWASVGQTRPSHDASSVDELGVPAKSDGRTESVSNVQGDAPSESSSSRIVEARSPDTGSAEADMVSRFVRNLPDLSYMLR